MTEKFRNKYRVQSTRLYGYDYRRNGAYFITICTKKHICFFGNIVVVETGLRPVSTLNVRPVSTLNDRPVSTLNDRPVSTLNDRPVSTNNKNDSTGRDNQDCINNNVIITLSDEGKIVSDCWFDLPNHYLNIILDEFIVMPNHIHGIILIQNYKGKPRTHGLSEFVRALKSFSSRRINEYRNSNLTETWQPRFYDHIIRSDNELNRIRNYIKNNPNNWLNDEHYVNSNNIL
jgi:REP element-mobilizing transposase RayT